ncbi:MAG: YggS family pyridoxal phosphate-dependent enzyme [Chloroflexi bacterium]|nr:YggS family pyridoxal phosphate-dependent enzyme [Chloroflexota bacterium]
MTATETLTARLAVVRARITAACERAGRDPAEVTLVAVSKTHPLDSVRDALAAGLTDLGENRAQELVPKAEAAAAAGLAPRWHFIGHLQRNKARDVLPHIAVLHSLDSPSLIAEIERRLPAPARVGAAPRLRCYLEVNVAGEAQKDGVSPDDLASLLSVASASPALEVVGLMTVAPLVPDPEVTRPVFRTLRELARAHGLAGLSMGMTDDFEVAIEEGATAVRVGRAIFGERQN